jgi:FkbM family methyltransferase
VGYLPDGSRIDCDLRDHVQRQIYFQGVYEPVEAFLFCRLLRPGNVVIDAGANVGQYTLLAASSVGDSGFVHSFEPVPRNYERLRDQVTANRAANVKLNRLALWHEPAELRLGLPTDEVNDGSYSVGAAGDSTVPVVTAPAVRLDDYVRENAIGQVDFIKMDIEGAEWSALRGMSDILARDRPILLMEVNREACCRMAYSPEVFWEVLVGRYGYTAWQVGLSAGDWRSLSDCTGIDRANVLFATGLLPDVIARGWDFQTCLRWARRGGGRG